jgi:cytochrome c5
MKALLISAVLCGLLLPGISLGQDQPLSGEEVYNKSCAACHKTGLAGAPKLGDASAWESRIKKGMDELYESSLEGKGAMPAKGGDRTLSDAAVKAAVDFMINASK